MPYYENGKETREIILNVCKKLFYEKGYENVTYDDISKASNIYRSSIQYHFKSKSIIRDIIAFEECEKNTKEAKKYAGCTNLEYILNSYIFWYKFLNDERYRNFISYRGDAFADGTEVAKFFFSCFNNAEEDFGYFIEKHQLDVIICGGLDIIISEYLSKNIGEYSFIEAAEYELRTMAKILDIPFELINKKIIQARAILGRINFELIDSTLR